MAGIGGFHESLVESALAEGFAYAGGVDLASVIGGPFDRHVERYDAWIADGRHGSMEYLVRGRDRRADPRNVFPGTQSVFCALLPYSAAPIGDGVSGPRYARYLRNRDYHKDVYERLERAMTTASKRSGEFKWKVCVDTSAVLERAWAQLAGLGWIGKNTMLIHPKLGSYSFIGAVLIDREVGLGARPLPDYCGNCDRCLKGCPTKAFTAPREIDSRRCISYLTLEHRGEWTIPEADRSAMGTWVAGCDICQEACPFNSKTARVAMGIDPADAIEGGGWDALDRESDETYRARVADSALKRIKYPDFRRNLEQAKANRDG